MASTMTVVRLQEIRRKNGISLEQIAETTKISTRFLRAIEAEEYEKLPGGVFNTSYIRQYAAAIGLPEDELLAHYGAIEAAREAEEREIDAVRPSFGFRCMSWLRGETSRHTRIASTNGQSSY